MFRYSKKNRSDTDDKNSKIKIQKSKFMRSITSFVCQECGYETPEWLGKCPECGEWNSLREFQISRPKDDRPLAENLNLKPRPLSEIKFHETDRILTGFSEVDGVLGGGVVPGSVVLLAGDPGIGKSTLLLQIAINVAGRLPTLQDDARSSPPSVLYISGEESEEQIKLRTQRIAKNSKDINLLLLSATSTDAIGEIIANTKPFLVIIDSIQTMESAQVGGLSGSVPQVRFATAQFIKLAKALAIPIILVGHVTKEGTIAGPMILSHMVDCLLFLEGEKTTGTRILRSLKNRFGPVDEVGIFSMNEGGMTEIKNPEQVFLSQKSNNGPGSVLVVTMEGTRAFLVEIQALVLFSKLPFPRRVAAGIDYKRLELLLAVLQKHCKLPIDTSDVFVNVAGGLRLSDPGADLGICLAVFSSFKNIALSKTVGIAEVGLLGELRNVSSLEKRIKQAKRLGFKQIISSESYNYLNEVLRTLEK